VDGTSKIANMQSAGRGQNRVMKGSWPCLLTV
jgi:hypothetical protein